jgi:hypothetical protein
LTSAHRRPPSSRGCVRPSWCHRASTLALTGGALVSVLPLTTRERPGWAHRVRIDIPGTQTGHSPAWRLTDDQIAEVRRVLAQMLDA